MGFRYFNPNPKNKQTTDCVIRMLAKVYDLKWVDAFKELIPLCISECDIPSSNYIWEKYLVTHGFRKRLLFHDCPDCMSIREFADTFTNDIYVACTGTHVVAICYGNYYDAWDSGNEIVAYYFERR